MKKMLLACAGVLAVTGALSLSVAPAAADVVYPWCAESTGDSSKSCSFVTFAQCEATLSGQGGLCTRNQMHIDNLGFASAQGGARPSLGGAAVGAGLGAVVGGPVGAVVGAGIGANTTTFR